MKLKTKSIKQQARDVLRDVKIRKEDAIKMKNMLTGKNVLELKVIETADSFIDNVDGILGTNDTMVSKAHDTSLEVIEYLTALGKLYPKEKVND